MDFLRGVIPGTNPPRIHTWSFLEPEAVLDIWPETTTGALSISGTTLTADAATFYPSMAGRTIMATHSEKSYTIGGYTSATIITTTADASADNGDTFTIEAGRYALPYTFGGFLSPFTAYRSSTYTNAGIKEVSTDEIFADWRDSDETSELPHKWAMISRSGTGYDIIVSPLPSAYRQLRYQYRAVPTDISDGTGTFLGGLWHSWTIRQMALARAELETGHAVGPHAERAAIDLLASIELDRRLFRRGGTEQVIGWP